MIAIIGLLLIMLTGYFCIEVFAPRFYKLEKVALGYVTGLGVLTLIFFYLNFFGLKFTFNSFFTITSGIAALFWLLSLFRRKEQSLQWLPEVKLKKLDSLLFISFGVILVSLFIMGLYWPVRDWDALTLYDFRGKVMFETGFISNTFIHIYYLAYPMLTSVAHAFLYVLGGNPPIIYPLYYLSFVVAFFILLKRVAISDRLALLFTFSLASSVIMYNHALMSYTNLPYLIYLSLGYFYLVLAIHKPRADMFLVSCLMIVLSIWTRSDEPFWVLPVLMAGIYFVIKRRFHLALLYALPIGLMKVAWLLTKSDIIDRYNLQSAMTTQQLPHLSLGFLLTRIGEVTWYFYQYIIEPYQLLFLLLLICLPLVYKLRSYLILLFLSLIVMNLGVIYAGIFYVSLVYIKWEDIGGSASRMSIFFIPMILFFIPLVIHQLLEKGNKNEE